jgi:hypothetical protein
MLKADTKINFQSEKIIKAIKKATKKGIREATAYLYKVIRNSIRREGMGRKKKYELKILTGNYRIAGKQGKHVAGNQLEYDAKQFLRSPNRSKDKIVVRESKRDERNPQPQSTYLSKAHSRSGVPPKSHKAQKKGWYDYWLKKSIQADFKNGKVFLNPARKMNQKTNGLSKSFPQLLEMGGSAKSVIRYLYGYYYYPFLFKNGKKTVAYTKIYKQKTKSYYFKPRPFMKTALMKSEKKILEILQRNLKK